jgi:hypothetical protein
MTRSNVRTYALVLGLLLLSAFGLNQSAFAQANGNATTNGGGTVIRGVSITKNVDLEFGEMVSSSTSGTVVLSAAATTSRSATGGVTLASQGGITPTAAEFRVSGNPNYTYTITLPTTVTITRSGGTETMTIDTFTKSVASPQLNGLGTELWYAGATLNVGADQVAGRYDGTFQVGVAYN